MHKQQAPMRAAIDIGRNTIHIVVARCKPDDLDIVEDEVELVRIGESVNASGEISPEKRDAAIATLRQYKELAQQHGAEQILVVAVQNWSWRKICISPGVPPFRLVLAGCTTAIFPQIHLHLMTWLRPRLFYSPICRACV